jgi:hypothetical protein
MQCLRVNAHSKDNSPDMKSQVEGFAERFEIPWTEYAEELLPRKLRMYFENRVTPPD